MKRFIAVITGLLIMPAFAEVAPIYWDAGIEYADENATGETGLVEEEVVEQQVQPVAPAAAVNTAARASARNTASRAMPAVNATTSARNTNSGSRAVASRNTVTMATSRATTPAGVAARAGTPTNNTVSARRAAPTANATTARAGIVQTDTVNAPLYNSSSARVSVRPSASGGQSTANAMRTSSAIRSASISTSSTTTTADTSLDELAEMTEYCKAQYTQCMDNFCNVLDDNQGRCSCSANVKNYTKTEDALKAATEELQDVAQKIQYIGLTKDEVTTLFNQTEAEATMQGKTDNTQIKNDLDRIRNLIVDVKTGTATSAESGMSLDLSSLLDFSFSSTGFDLGTLFGNTTNTNSISNQRGAELFKTATARCKASVLNSCTAQGVDAAIITNSYDLEIDKQCIAYERNLTDANTQMTSTVRNAKTVLQKARLVVAQQKNSYDLRGCVNALDTCMQDEFVCGSDYENCLDSTGKYIVNGEIVVGSQPGVSGNINATSGLYFDSWGAAASSPWGNGNLTSFISSNITSGTTNPANSVNTHYLVGYLQSKIGYVDTNSKSAGMCVSVLNKCQDYTYTSTSKTYDGNNDVIKNYLQRTLMQIKTKQDEVLASYAERCQSDLLSCLTTNNSSYYSTNNDLANTAKSACRNLANTCASVNGLSNASDAFSTEVWNNMQSSTTIANAYADSACTVAADGKKGSCPRIGYRCNGTHWSVGGQCLNTCPANSAYDEDSTTVSTENTTATGTGIPAKFCKCVSGYKFQLSTHSCIPV